MRGLEFAFVNNVLVELKRLGRYPLLCFDGYDVVATDDFSAMAKTIVEAYFYNGIGWIQESG